MATKRSSKSAKLEEGSERSPKKKASSSSSSSSGEPQYSPEKVSEAFPGCAVSLKPPTRNEPGGAFHFFAAKGASSLDKGVVATFLPNRSPEEVLRAGAFGGTYFRTIDSGVVKQTLKEAWRELPDSWIKGLDPSTHLARPWKSYDESVNKFKKKSGTTLEDWESSGWITAHDPFGWFQWYCRFFQGRRCEDDARQIDRWRKCCGPTGRWKGNLCGKVAVAQAAYDDPAVSPVVRQTLLHWGYELTCNDFEAAIERMGKGKGAVTAAPSSSPSPPSPFSSPLFSSSPPAQLQSSDTTAMDTAERRPFSTISATALTPDLFPLSSLPPLSALPGLPDHDSFGASFVDVSLPSNPPSAHAGAAGSAIASNSTLAEAAATSAVGTPESSTSLPAVEVFDQRIVESREKRGGFEMKANMDSKAEELEEDVERNEGALWTILRKNGLL